MMNDEQKQALIERLNKLAEGLKWHNVAYSQDVLSAVTALTQPASPAFKLPDGWVAVPNEPNEDMLAAGSAVDGGVYSIWKDMVGASPDAPLTAPIEPICTTGGAEWVKVPRKLTAANGAKSALIGEFKEEYSVSCPECFGEEECETCDGSGRIHIEVPVSWTTIKAIWDMGVEHFTAAPEAE